MTTPRDDTDAIRMDDVADTNGAAKQVSQGDVLGLTDVGSGYNPLAELWSMPKDVDKWAPRARFQSMEDINAILEMVSEDLVLTGGYCDYTALHYYQQTMRIGLDGEARREMLAAMNAATDRESQRWGFMGKLFGKGNGGSNPADRGNPVKD